MKATIRFSECEHYGDMDNYCSDLRESGATVLNTNVDTEAEEGMAEVEIQDKEAFLAKFKETDSYDFSSIA